MISTLNWTFLSEEMMPAKNFFRTFLFKSSAVCQIDSRTKCQRRLRLVKLSVSGDDAWWD